MKIKFIILLSLLYSFVLVLHGEEIRTEKCNGLTIIEETYHSKNKDLTLYFYKIDRYTNMVDSIRRCKTRFGNITQYPVWNDPHIQQTFKNLNKYIRDCFVKDDIAPSPEYFLSSYDYLINDDGSIICYCFVSCQSLFDIYTSAEILDIIAEINKFKFATPIVRNPKESIGYEEMGGTFKAPKSLVKKDNDTKAEEPATASQEAEPEEEVPVNPAEAVISSLKQITPEISKIIEELDGGGNIIVDESQRTRYDSQNKQICIGAEPTDEKVLHAIIHYIQDTQDELSYENNSVNNEFEASWLTFLTYFIRYGVFNDKVTLGLSSNENREMEEYLIKSLSGNCTINSCFYDFMDQYMTNDHLDKFSEEKRQSLNNDSSRDGYWHSRDYDYEYNWLQKLEMLGFKYSN